MSETMLGLKEEKELIQNAIEHDHHVLLIGETGLGKTQLIKEFSTQKEKKLHRVSLNGEVGLNEILGRWLVKDGSTFWQDGVLLEAMKSGDWIVFDEINAALPEVLFCLNALLDDEKSILIAEKDNEVVKSHKDFRFFATMNPSDSYVGTKDMNQALLSRFHIVIQMQDYPAEMEKSIIKHHVPNLTDDDVLDLALQSAHIIRNMKRDGDIMSYFSTRDLINMSKVISTSGKIKLNEALNYSFVNKLSTEERDSISRKLKDSLGIDLFKATISTSGVGIVHKFKKKIDLLQSEVSRLESVKNTMKEKITAKIAKSLIEGDFYESFDERGQLKPQAELALEDDKGGEPCQLSNA